MKVKGQMNCPYCGKSDCFACDGGKCVVLVDNNFRRECPFYKTKEQVEKEQAYCDERMANILKK